jgi:tetratricopeptide (TPR) repeat protein/transcriptional regulator with XRE-family HTH domain
MFGALVRAQRRRLGLSQEELAERIRVSPRTIGNLETGRIAAPRPATVRLLADAFGLTGPERDRFCQAAVPAPAQEPHPLPAPAPLVPGQLPPDVATFAGRADQLERLTELLDRGRSALVITAIGGTAGVGKTALAVHWAHQVAHRFPDGQLYVNLRGFDAGGQAMTPTEALRGFLDALGATSGQVPTDLGGQVARYRSLVAGKRVLVLLDNARDAEQVRPLLPGAPSALAMVTSRNQLTALVASDGAHPLALDLLTVEEARELLCRRLGPERVSAEPRAAGEIIRTCARLPLALAIAAARVQQTGFPLASVAAELDEAGQRLDALDAGDASSQVRAVLSWSYRALSRPARRLFRLLGLHPGPDVSMAAAASLAGLAPAEARRLLGELTRTSLLGEHAPGRYALHDLLRVYAAELAKATETGQERRTALGRLLDHYVHNAYAAERLLYPHRAPIPLPPASPNPAVSAERPTDQARALAWMTVEHPVLVGMLRLAVEARSDAPAFQLAWALDTFLERQGHWHELVDAWRLATEAAERLGDPTVQAYAHSLLAYADGLLRRFADAHTHLQHALDLYAAAGDRIGQAHIHQQLAILWERQDQPDKALLQGRQGLALYQEVGNRRGQAVALNSLGWQHALLGDHAEALRCCHRALALFQQLGDGFGEAHAWDSLGYPHSQLGDHVRATDCYQRALALYRDFGDRYNEAASLARLGDAHLAAGDPDCARSAWAAALEIFTGLGQPDADGLRGKLDRLPPA